MNGAPAIEVVALVVVEDGRVLMARRPGQKRHGGLYEFPGGKVDPGESLEEALVREVAEELDTRVRDIRATGYVRQEPGSRYRIHFLRAELTGAPRCVEHTALVWADAADLRTLSLAPVDRWFVGVMGMDVAAWGDERRD